MKTKDVVKIVIIILILFLVVAIFIIKYKANNRDKPDNLNETITINRDKSDKLNGTITIEDCEGLGGEFLLPSGGGGELQRCLEDGGEMLGNIPTGFETGICCKK